MNSAHDEFVGPDYNDSITVKTADSTAGHHRTMHGTNDAAVITGVSTAGWPRPMRRRVGGISMHRRDSPAPSWRRATWRHHGYGKFSIDRHWTYDEQRPRRVRGGPDYNDGITVKTADGARRSSPSPCTAPTRRGGDHRREHGGAGRDQCGAVDRQRSQCHRRGRPGDLCGAGQRMTGDHGCGKFLDRCGRKRHLDLHDEQRPRRVLEWGPRYNDSITVKTADGTAGHHRHHARHRDAAVITGVSTAECETTRRASAASQCHRWTARRLRGADNVAAATALASPRSTLRVTGPTR